jgi:hypothetical protein
MEDNVEQTILGVVLGTIFSIITTIAVEAARRPDLEIRIADQANDPPSPNSGLKKITILHLALANKPLKGPFSWLMRGVATQCHGTVLFRHMNGQPAFPTSMAVRWSSTPTPTAMTLVAGDKHYPILDPARLLLEGRVDVPVDDKEVFPVVARFDDDEECYGFNNESFHSSPPWRNPDRRLPKGQYLVDLTILSSGQKVSKTFTLLNEGSLSEFRLELSPAIRQHKG